ncbi:MAG: hypothetical protein RSB70_00325 [Clostridium sp.]
MRKPSIFSNDYNKQIKKRKRTLIFSATIIATCIGVTIYMSSNMGFFQEAKEKVINVLKFNKDTNKDIDEIKDTNIDDTLINPPQVSGEDITQSKTEIQKVDLGSDITIEIIIEEKDSVKNIVEIKNNEMVDFDISQAKDKIVLLNKKNQNTFLCNINGTITEITKKEYFDTNNRKYNKDEQLNLNPQLLWASSPKFISDNKILYLSKLPWFDKEHKLYIWIYDIEKNNHIVALDRRLQGNIIEVKSFKKESIDIEVDSKPFTISLDGKVLQP